MHMPAGINHEREIPHSNDFPVVLRFPLVTPPQFSPTLLLFEVASLAKLTTPNFVHHEYFQLLFFVFAPINW